MIYFILFLEQYCTESVAPTAARSSSVHINARKKVCRSIFIVYIFIVYHFKNFHAYESFMNREKKSFSKVSNLNVSIKSF